MTVRVLVVHPPTSVARDFIDYPWFSNLGAVQLATVLDSDIVDSYALPGSTLAWRTDDRAHLGAPVAEVLESCSSIDFDVAIVAYTPFHRPPRRCDVLGDLVSGLRRQSNAVLLFADCYQSGQHYVEAAGADVLASYPEVDAWVKYEAEQTLPELIARFDGAGERPRGVHEGVPLGRLDDLPFPAWDRIDLNCYQRFHERVVRNLGRAAWSFPIDGRTLPIVTSRGCPFDCAHCSSNPGRAAGTPKTQRRYSPERLSLYARELVQHHKATRLEVLDELLNVNEGHFERFLDLTETLAVRFDAPNGLRADFLTERHFERMKGRVTTVSVSAESGSQRVVTEIVNKKLDLRHIHAAAQNAHRAGVPLAIHYMIGLPGETAEEVNQTLALAFDLWDRFGAWPSIQYATPLPGTALARGRRLPVVDDWGPFFQKVPSQPGALVSREDLARFKWTAERRLDASQGPKKVVVNLTYVCNNHCTFCAVGTRTQVHGDSFRVQEHLVKYRRHGVSLVDFDGGEPTLHPDLVSIIRYARAIGYEKVNVTSNGRLCFYEDFADKLVNSGLTSLLFSVHGADAQTHAQQVGVAEAFEQTLGGIRQCVERSPRHVELGMNITLTKSNYAKLEAVAELALDLGLPWLNVQFLTPFGRATRHVAPDIRAAAAVTMRVIDRFRDRMKIQVINLPFCFMPGYEAFLLGDIGKLERHMVFVNNETVNLAQYLAERRKHEAVCGPCPHRVFCGGFYQLDDVPEPPWLIAPADLLRPVRDELVGR